jgi:hypothetical protein
MEAEKHEKRKNGKGGATDRVMNWHTHLIDLFACEYFCSLALLTLQYLSASKQYYKILERHCV